MQIGGIRLGRRRLAILTATAVVVGAIAALAGWLGAAWGQVLLAALGAGAIAVLAAVLVRLWHLQRVVTARPPDAPASVAQPAAGTVAVAEAHAKAVWDHLTSDIKDEPDRFVLYRIIGNDLPPRHREGQSLENLRFILEHEADLPACHKRWVVNRIADPEIDKQVRALLDEHGVPYLHIPFDAAAYRRTGWRFTGLPVPGFTYRREFDELTPTHQQWALDHVYHDKNLYVMNNNGARNAALRQGRELAKWVLPWDGSCFLTRGAWDQLVAAVAARPYLRYFTVPMARILDNESLLRPDPAVAATEEPQLVFRRDAAEQFNEDARYGRCPKAELFWRLGIEGPWDRWCRGPWDRARPALSPEAGQVGEAGWVARLYSGEKELERDIEGRGRRRFEAIRARIDRIDAALAAEAFRAADPLTLDLATLEQQRGRPDADVRRVVGELVTAAERAAAGRRRGDQLSQDVTVLTLAGAVTREARFLSRGADLLRSRFLAGRRRDRLRSVPAPDMHYLLDAVRLLEGEEVLTASEVAQVRSRVAERRAWLRDSVPGRRAGAALDCTGTWYDVEMIAIDAYLDDIGGMLATLRRVFERVGQQFDADGAQPEELRGPATLHHCVHNLQGWATLAGVARRLGQDLWSYQAADGQGPASAVQWLFRQLGGAWPYRQDRVIDRDRFMVLAHTAGGTHTGDQPAQAERATGQVRQVFDPHLGIRPFWAVG